MASEKVRLPNEHETYLATLYGKAQDSRAAHPILGDTFAADVVEHIEFDFARLNLPQGAAITLPMRAKHLDGWVREFLAANPRATVLNLGCGLDSRVFRVDPPASVRWYDVDLPEVIALRERLYPARHDYALLATSVTDLGWLDEIPADRPVLVVAEGLVMYLREQDGLALFRRITAQFPSGQLIFDAYARLTVRVLNVFARLAGPWTQATAAGARVQLPWGIDDPGAITQHVPGLRLVTAVSFLTMPELVAHLVHAPSDFAVYRLLERFAWYRDSMRHLRYAF